MCLVLSSQLAFIEHLCVLGSGLERYIYFVQSLYELSEVGITRSPTQMKTLSLRVVKTLFQGFSTKKWQTEALDLSSKNGLFSLYHVCHTLSVRLLGEMHIRTELTTNSLRQIGGRGLACPACPAEHMRTFSCHLLAALSTTLTPFFSALYVPLPLTLREGSLELLEL